MSSFVLFEDDGQNGNHNAGMPVMVISFKNIKIQKSVTRDREEHASIVITR